MPGCKLNLTLLYLNRIRNNLISNLFNNYETIISNIEFNQGVISMRNIKIFFFLTLVIIYSIPLNTYSYSQITKDKKENSKIKLRKGQVTTMDERKVANAFSSFGIEVLKKVARKNEESKNLMISPASIAIALSIAMNGACGETQEAFKRTLNLDDIELDEINNIFKELAERIVTKSEKVELRIANSIWSRKELKLKESFVEKNRKYYDSEIRSLDFSDPKSVEIINKWVDEKTNGKIPSIINAISPQDLIFIINAIYFNGKWEMQFDKSKTKDEIFHTFSGTNKKVPMMRIENKNFRYTENDEFSGIFLPYADKEKIMVALLPRNKKIDKFIEEMTWDKLKDWLSDFRMRKGTVIIPRFKFETLTRLKNILSELGLKVAFRNSADFCGMFENTDSNAFITGVIHKTFIDVNEEGTEAAAVTGIMVGTAIQHKKPEPFVFRADRPFFFMIIDLRTRLVLFSGVVLDPSKQSG